METLNKNEGLITQIIGPVIDVEFQQGELPEIYNALNSDEVTVSYKHWINAQNLADKDVPFLYITSPSLVYFAKEGLNIPDLGKLPVRGQGISVVEYMNTWTWDNK